MSTGIKSKFRLTQKRHPAEWRDAFLIFLNNLTSLYHGHIHRCRAFLALLNFKRHPVTIIQRPESG